MIIVNLKGGMGNQMFQYAMGKSLSLTTGTELRLDTTFLLDRSPEYTHVFRDYDLSIFKLKVQIANQQEIDEVLHTKSGLSRFFSFLSKPSDNKYVEKCFEYDKGIEELPSDVYLDGYWQTPRYFEKHEDVIREDFGFVNELTGKKLELKEKIASVNSVCVNIRRTDFLNTSFHGVCDAAYFDRGITHISQLVNNPEIFVFADDMEWCRANLKFNFPTHFVDHDYAGEKFQDYLHLMTHCKNFIIPNSSFAWWAAYLTNNKDQVVVAPKNWFSDPAINTADLIPANWIRL